MALSKLNAKGSIHLIVPLLVVVAVAAIGVFALVAGHADSCPTVSGVSNPVSGSTCPVSGPTTPAPVPGYTEVSVNNQYYTAIYACKTYVNAYGGVYSMKYLYVKPAALARATYKLYAARNGVAYYNQSASAWYVNTVASYTTNISIPLRDVITASILVNGSSINTYTTSYPGASSISTCKG